MGEVAERSEDGEGRSGCNTLSVTLRVHFYGYSLTCGDSSPRGRAKGLYPTLRSILARKWSVSLPTRSIHCFTATHQRGSFLRAAPHNSSRSLRQDFCSNSKFRKWRNTVCISHFRNCGSGAKRRLRLADAIVRCCLSFMPDKSPCRPAWFRSSPAWRPAPEARAY